MHPSITIQKEASPHGVPIDDPLFDTIRKGRVECVVLFPNGVWTTSADTYILDTCTSLINTWNAKHVEHYVVYCKYSAIQEEVNAYAFRLFNIHVKGPVKFRLLCRRTSAKTKCATLQARVDSLCSIVYPIPFRPADTMKDAPIYADTPDSDYIDSIIGTMMVARTLF
jgi:hypothetical protein